MLGGRRKAHAKSLRSHNTSTDRRTGHGYLNQSHFSLQDEARNTERAHNWVSRSQLRHAKVDFVSSGKYNGEEVTRVNGRSEEQAVPLGEASTTAEDPSLETSMAKINFGDSEENSMLDQGMHDGAQQDVSHLNGNHASSAIGLTEDGFTQSNDAFVIDGQGNSDRANTGFLNPKIPERSLSPTPSVSSEEIVVFRGRRNAKPPSTRKRSNQGNAISIEDPASAATVGIDPLASTRAMKVDLATTSVSNSTTVNHNPIHRFEARAESSRQVEESLLADYIANMDPSLATTVIADDYEGDAHTGSGLRTPFSPEEKDKDLRGNSDVTREPLRASDADRAPVIGSEADDSASSLNSNSDDDEDDEDDDLQWEVNNIISEEERLHKKTLKMTDAQIARLLAKQEELGLGSDEVVLFDGADGVDSSSLVDFSDNYRSSAKRNSRKAKRARKPDIASKSTKPELTEEELFGESALHEPHYGFDPMDFERPSLQRKRKGRKEALDFDLSGSDLAAQMATTWNNDRAKKRSRKEERQRQREQTWDAQTTGSSGNGRLGDAKRQIRAFLQSERTSISFPPMNKRDRRALHELANRLTLTSKSHGNGHKRFPVLYRTRRTPDLSDDEFDRIVEQLSRRFSSLRASKSTTRNTPGVGRNGGYSHAAVSCRDGEVVGAGAAELGHENRGRAMLEKMGWSTGTAIGALNNKGIMQPVVHIVKTTKAGLG